MAVTRIDELPELSSMDDLDLTELAGGGVRSSCDTAREGTNDSDQSFK